MSIVITEEAYLQPLHHCPSQESVLAASLPINRSKHQHQLFNWYIMSNRAAFILHQAIPVLIELRIYGSLTSRLLLFHKTKLKAKMKCEKTFSSVLNFLNLTNTPHVIRKTLQLILKVMKTKLILCLYCLNKLNRNDQTRLNRTQK